MKIRPFREGDAYATFTNIIDNTVGEIDSLDNEYVLKTSPAELESYYLGKATVQPLEISGEYYIENKQGIRIDVTHDFNHKPFSGARVVVPGTQLDIAIPFGGDPSLWKVRPSTYRLSGYPEIEIRDGTIVFSCSFPDDTASSARIKSEIERSVKSIADAVRNLRNDVDNHNN